MFLAPKGAAQRSPGREPWVTGPQSAKKSPKGATHSECAAPLGLLLLSSAPDTQGLRPGLRRAAPFGAETLSAPLEDSRRGETSFASRLNNSPHYRRPHRPGTLGRQTPVVPG